MRRDRMKNKKVKRKKLLFISVITLIVLMAFLFTGFKVYAYFSTPKSIPSKVERIVNPDKNEVIKPNDSNNQDVSLAFQDGKEVEKADSIKITETGTLPERKASKEKVVYLTFDDGPTSNVTPVVLDTLKKYNVKATFFVLGKMVENHPDILKREYNEGHLIGNHSYSHDYKYIYSTPDNFITDMKKSEDIINNVLGLDGKLEFIRFPSGSFGKSREIYRQAAAKNGYYYIDWNCLNGDAQGKKNEAQLVEEVIKTSKGKNEVVVLMHDSATKMSTANTLGQVIEYFKSQGYRFDTLNNYYK